MASNIGTFDARRRALRLPVKHLAAAAGLDEDNVHRVLRNQTDPRQSTVAAIDAALTAEETRLQQYLLRRVANERSA